MAASSDVAAFRAAGHTVAETMARFGLSERSVYKALARARRGVASAVAASVDDSSSGRSPALSGLGAPAALSSSAPGGAPQFPTVPDDVAGDNTYWRCPVSGELVPVVPGSRRHGWMEERRRIWSRSACPPVELAAPVEVPASVELAAPVEVPAPVELAAPGPVVAAVRVPAGLDAPAPVPGPVVAAVRVPAGLGAPAPAPGPALVPAPVSALVRHNLWPAVAGWLAIYWRVPVAVVLALVLVLAAF